VTNDAVSDLAEPRQMNEQALLEQRGQRVVQIARLREAPELLDEAGCTRRGTEKFGSTPKRDRTSAENSSVALCSKVHAIRLQTMAACYPAAGTGYVRSPTFAPVGGAP
jgi:hypothetical protein